ncbi:ABC transporter ATP-binding protein [Paenibacillus abyssi]|uniref:Iron ABC transporter ATP-binding protein n=1 Tax=Paenibacillus abyssi TaxID=1340531 RepID=A0A917FR24_9BACL|nr:ABC transporter ATP-binding protein [Paenibacillus abyssi]GGG00969.1 iron ABC transporter ATP-binding protein [Paenibacillus abyssi]
MLNVRALYKEFPNDQGETVKAAQDITLEVPEGKLFTMLGPSGCGKTTTLRSIAGLERPTSGEITVDGKLMYSSEKKVFVQPNRRDIGMVFQSYAIWPHMDVFKNTAFPLEVGKKKLSKKQIEEKVLRALHVVALDGLESREATKLSGGQQQRLALARALVMEPKLLLLDEPLSNLDAKLRERMRFELKRLQRDLGITSIYVTHDQSEALALSNQIAVMNAGRIIQIGTPREIYEKPGSQFVADFIGSTNFVEGVVESVVGEGYILAKTKIGLIKAYSAQEPVPGSKVVISIRPENIHVSHERPTDGNVAEGQIDTRIFLGEYVDLQLKVGESLLQARTHPSLRYPAGTQVYLGMDPEKCIALLDAKSPPAEKIVVSKAVS